MKLSLKNNIARVICFIVTFIIALCSLFLPTKVFASDNYVLSKEITIDTKVLDDLKQNTDFNVNNYPNEFEDEYGFKVIQIAEGTDGNLYLYIYHSALLIDLYPLTTVNLSTSIDDEEAGTKLDGKLYNLVLLDSTETLHKYLVFNCSVKKEEVRHYLIASIHRKYVDGVDKEPSEDNVINETAIPINQSWSVTTDSGYVNYSYEFLETITITDKFVGFIRYLQGYSGFLGTKENACDRHFVAFNTDKRIDDLISAKVSYCYNSYVVTTTTRLDMTGLEGLLGTPVVSTTVSEGDSNNLEVVLDKDVEHSSSYLSFFGRNVLATYKWKEIETPKQLIDGIENTTNVLYSGALLEVTSVQKLTEEQKSTLNTYSWVVSFACTDFIDEVLSYNQQSTLTEERSTRVSEATILQLDFMTDGVPYSMLAVDDKTTGSDKPFISVNPFDDINVNLTKDCKDLLKLLCLILLVVLLIVLWPLIKLIFVPFKLFFTSIKKKNKKKNKTDKGKR